MECSQWRLRTLLMLVAVLAILFAFCARWPVKVALPMSYEAPDSPGTYRVVAVVEERLPTMKEFMTRVAVYGIGLLVAVSIVWPAWRGVQAWLSSRRQAAARS